MRLPKLRSECNILVAITEVYPSQMQAQKATVVLSSVLYVGLPLDTAPELQLVENATGSIRSHHITAMLGRSGTDVNLQSPTLWGELGI